MRVLERQPIKNEGRHEKHEEGEFVSLACESWLCWYQGGSKGDDVGRVERTELGDVVGQASETRPRDENVDVASVWMCVSPERDRELCCRTNRSSGEISEKCLVRASIMGV